MAAIPRLAASGSLRIETQRAAMTRTAIRMSPVTLEQSKLPRPVERAAEHKILLEPAAQRSRSNANQAARASRIRITNPYATY